MAESLEEREEVIHQMFSMFDKDNSGGLEAPFVQAAHEIIRMGGISLPQVQASMGYVCVDADVCEEWEFIELLKEMDRRYYLVQNFRWEFSLLDQNSTDTISEEKARWFMQSVHGQYFSRDRWDRFIKSRPAPSTGVSFSEIEVELCNIPCMSDILDDLQDEKEKKEAKKREEEEKRKLKLKREEDRKRMLEQLEESQRQQQDEKRRQEEEQKKQDADKRRLEEEEAQRLEEEKERRRLEQEEEERKRRENEEMLERLKREEEERKKREEEEARDIEIVAQEAAEAEKIAKREAEEAAEKLKRAEDAKTKKEMEDLQREAQKRQKESKEKKIRANLKVSIKTRKREPIKKNLGDFKKAKYEDYDGDVPKAEKILKLMEVKEGLSKAMAKRDIKELEEAINLVRRSGYETELQREMIEANQLLLRLRRLERIRAEILELKQSTVAEIRSYQVPPEIVHYVMIGTFLLLGHHERECKEWKKVQALVGKTGKEGLKRRCLEYDPSNLAKKLELAQKAKNKMASFELDDVRDVSAGAATFYLWAMNMIEEAEDIASQVESD